MRRLILSSLFCISPYIHAKDEAMNILYASDEGYAIPTCVSIASILANCPSEDKLNIIVVDTGMSEKSRQAIKKLKKIRDFQLEFRKFDMERLKIFDVGEWSPSIRIKLYINEFFPNAEKAMWVNGNIIFRKNIKQLYDVDFTGKYFATYSGFFGCVCDGLVLYNIQLMKHEHIYEYIVDRTIFHQHGEYKAEAGEHALNDVCKSKRILYSSDICKCVCITDMYDYDLHDYVSIKFEHRYGFCPWKYPKSLYPEKAIKTYDEWHKYCDMTDYKGLGLKLSNNYNVMSVFNYYRLRFNSFLVVTSCKYRSLIINCELKVLSMLLKIINFINENPKNA